MFGLGATELIIILVIVVILFGAQRLPEIGKGIGDRFQPLAGLAAPVPCTNAPVGLQDLALDQLKLCRQGHQALTGC